MGLNDFCAGGQSNPVEVQTTTIRLRDPHQELDVLSVPTRDSLGQLTGRLWLVSDVTREREAEALARASSQSISSNTSASGSVSGRSETQGP